MAASFDPSSTPKDNGSVVSIPFLRYLSTFKTHNKPHISGQYEWSTYTLFVPLSFDSDQFGHLHQLVSDTLEIYLSISPLHCHFDTFIMRMNMPTAIYSQYNTVVLEQ